MRFLVLLLASVCCASVSAQTVQFRPLAIGDQWMYQYESAYSPSSTTCPSLTPQSYLRARVLRDTTLNGAEARVVGCTAYTLGGVATAEGATGVPAAFASSQALNTGGRACLALFGRYTPRPPTASVPAPNPVAIGGAQYVMGSVAITYEEGGGIGGQYAEFTYRFGDRVGMTSWDHIYHGRIDQPTCYREVYTLTYAVVGGETFGATPVAGEDAPSGAATVPMRAYPVPAQTSVTVEVGATGAVEVVDALGRLVASGEAAPGRPLVLDVSAWPAGVYVARASGVDGAVQTARLVVVR